MLEHGLLNQAAPNEQVGQVGHGGGEVKTTDAGTLTPGDVQASVAWSPASSEPVATVTTASGAVWDVRVLRSEFARYAAVGGLAFALDYSVLLIATALWGLPYLISAALGFCGGLVMNYVLSVRYVFQRRRSSSGWNEFRVFTIIGVVGLTLNEAIMWALTDGVGLHYSYSKLAAAGSIYVWNFAARKHLLF